MKPEADAETCKKARLDAEAELVARGQVVYPCAWLLPKHFAQRAPWLNDEPWKKLLKTGAGRVRVSGRKFMEAKVMAYTPEFGGAFLVHLWKIMPVSLAKEMGVPTSSKLRPHEENDVAWAEVWHIASNTAFKARGSAHGVLGLWAEDNYAGAKRRGAEVGANGIGAWKRRGISPVPEHCAGAVKDALRALEQQPDSLPPPLFHMPAAATIVKRRGLDGLRWARDYVEGMLDKYEEAIAQAEGGKDAE